jgi:hypothetical protein
MVWRKVAGSYRYDYDDIIVNYMAEEQLISSKAAGRYTDSVDPFFNNVRKSRIELYDIVREKSGREIGHDTIQRHLDKLVKDKVLIKNPKGGSRNRKFYRLSPMFVLYLCMNPCDNPLSRRV